MSAVTFDKNLDDTPESKFIHILLLVHKTQSIYLHRHKCGKHCQVILSVDWNIFPDNKQRIDWRFGSEFCLEYLFTADFQKKSFGQKINDKMRGHKIRESSLYD